MPKVATRMEIAHSVNYEIKYPDYFLVIHGMNLTSSSYNLQPVQVPTELNDKPMEQHPNLDDK
jgi:hypothetical protein